MVIVQSVPNAVIENALNTLKGLGKESKRYGFSIDEAEDFWLVHFVPLNPNTRGGETKVRIAKDTLDVIEVLRYQ